MIGRANRMRRKPVQMSDVTLTPLIDTALVLLVIFMVASPMMHRGIKLNLPKGQVEENKNVSKPITVSIDKNEELYLNGEPAGSINQLLENLTVLLNAQKEQPVYIHADTGSSYGTVYQVMDKIKYVAGVEHVILSAEKTA